MSDKFWDSVLNLPQLSHPAASREAADFLTERVREEAPVRTGTLRDSVETQEEDGNSATVVGGGDAYYAPFVEEETQFFSNSVDLNLDAAFQRYGLAAAREFQRILSE